MDLVKLFASADPRGGHIINAFLCLLGAMWVAGVKKTEANKVDRRAWIGFWLATAAYYVTATFAVGREQNLICERMCLAACGLPECGPPLPMVAYGTRLGPPFEQLGLYVATAFLLWANERLRWPRRRGWLLPSLLVMGAALSDWAIKHHFGVTATGVHQCLTAVALGIPAWRLRKHDEGKSVTLLTYALVQLPIQPLLDVWGIETSGYGEFVTSTFLVYAVLKLAVIPVTCFIAAKGFEPARV
jgi:hypothetical protein